MLSRPLEFRGGPRRRQRGAAMVEFVVVGPIITILGLAILQYCLMFFAKSQINHAAFMAARAGSVAHANIGTIRTAYQRALVPLYGGGQSTAELTTSYAKAVADLSADTLRIEVINPTKESFDDYAKDASLNDKYQARAISNTGIALRAGQDSVGANSGQTLQDANFLKLRVTHGYKPKVWLVGMLYTKYQQWLDAGADSFNTRLIDAGRIPIVSHVTLEMQSDAVEQMDGDGQTLVASNPGQGNNGQPINPGDPALTDKPAPQCLTMACSVTYTPSDPGTGGGSSGGAGSGNGNGNGPGGLCTGDNCPVCDP